MSSADESGSGAEEEIGSGEGRRGLRTNARGNGIGEGDSGEATILEFKKIHDNHE